MPLTNPREQPCGKAVFVLPSRVHRVDPLVRQPVEFHRRVNARRTIQTIIRASDVRWAGLAASTGASECKREREDRVCPLDLSFQSCAIVFRNDIPFIVGWRQDSAGCSKFQRQIVTNKKP